MECFGEIEREGNLNCIGEERIMGHLMGWNLDGNLHDGTWKGDLIGYVGNCMMGWLDEPKITKWVTASLCIYLN
jgi:hypothetical protein